MSTDGNDLVCYSLQEQCYGQNRPLMPGGRLQTGDYASAMRSFTPARSSCRVDAMVRSFKGVVMPRRSASGNDEKKSTQGEWRRESAWPNPMISMR